MRLATLVTGSGISYVTVAGAAIVGNNAKPDKDDEMGSEADELYKRRGEGSAARVAFNNYNALSGDGTLVGDGVIPKVCAHLEGATQLTLDGAIHSINEAGTALPTERWYGSEDIVCEWLKPALEELSIQLPEKKVVTTTEASRRTFATQLLTTLALTSFPSLASALVTVDVNNSVAREYSALPGLYPTIATKLIKRGPFKSKKDMYDALDSDAEVERLKGYDKQLKIVKRDAGIMQFKESQICKYECKGSSDYQNQQMKQIQSERRY
ncbi:hypothetical protein TL16_g12383 [Triparma laevis f. inornata]|uniref:Photosystem II 12 kDa extrinsic protein n=1 Tax=Triparma laevis f. inornata TaxID=1714386 RepID=A0A9W7EUU6_9STRA|nr:hypothetical protein TL16_g12383 [Triparma laevis f. inornata]